MASASSPLQIVDDDDDELDREAAVHEIDAACQETAATAAPISNGKREMPVNIDEEMRKKRKIDAISPAPSARQTTVHGASPCNSRKFEVKAGVSDGQQRMSSSFGVKIDAEAAKTWIYPVGVNVPCGNYQLSVTRTALFANTLVVLPTGVEKNVIPAVVMYNFFRWFPKGKIVFATPSREVAQQIEACHKIVGIPQEWTIDLTGGICPLRRAEYWKCKRVFFISPHALDEDIKSGSCLVKNLVCLVIDEAHRATGNYPYCGVVRELMNSTIQLRILALTATPGSNQQTIQHVIDNLQISTLDCRNECDPGPGIMSFVHDRNIEVIQVSRGDEVTAIDSLLLEAGHPFRAQLCTFGLLPNKDAQSLSIGDFRKSKDMFRLKPTDSVPQSRHGEFMGYFGALIELHRLRRKLSSHGIRPALEMLSRKPRKGEFAQMLGRSEAFFKAKLLLQDSPRAPGHKLVKMLGILTEYFKVKDSKNSRVIIFSNIWGVVRDIYDVLDSIGESVKAADFIGQISGRPLEKVPQAFLQKIWADGYNALVAISVDKERFDITEFDLVICFDADVSPLRMIQRMGQTGRNKEARVVLACEGEELSGFMQKQGHRRYISNLMINGGTNSFKFHPSPRMVPHFLNPELRVLQMPIVDVPRGVSEGLNQEPRRNPIRMKAAKSIGEGVNQEPRRNPIRMEAAKSIGEGADQEPRRNPIRMEAAKSVGEGVNQEPRRNPIRMKAAKSIGEGRVGGSSSVTPPASSETNRALMYQVLQTALYADTSTMNPQQQDVHWKMILGLQKDLGL